MFNAGSERNLISICLKNPDRLIDVDTACIYAEHFAVPGHKYIYMSMLYLYKKNIQPTPMSILEVLPNDIAKTSVEDLGGLEYLSILSEGAEPERNLDIFIEKIQQSHIRKMLYNTAEETKSFVLSDKAEVLNPTELIAYVEEKIETIQGVFVNDTQLYKMGDETESVLQQRAANPDIVPGLETGWVQLDRYTNGGLPGDLIILCAPSKVGKSVTLTNWATKLAIHDKLPILYIDTEMNSREQEDRILANLSGIPHSEIISGLYVTDTVNGTGDDKIAKIKEAREKLNMGEYYHIFLPQFQPEQVASICKKFMVKLGIKAVFFDYIKIPSSQSNFGGMKEYQALGYFTSSLKELAGLLEIPIYTAAQTNRNDLDGEDPDATDIGGSYRILQLASKLMFLVNKSDERIAKEGHQAGNQQIFVKYQRNGQSNCPPINIMFQPHILRQEEV